MGLNAAAAEVNENEAKKLYALFKAADFGRILPSSPYNEANMDLVWGGPNEYVKYPLEKVQALGENGTKRSYLKMNAAQVKSKYAHEGDKWLATFPRALAKDKKPGRLTDCTILERHLMALPATAIKVVTLA